MGLFVLFTGIILIFISFMFLPLAFIKPYKFVALNSLGTMTVFSSLIIMRGVKMCKKLLSRKMIIFTFLFLFTLLFEIYFSVVRKEYFMVIMSFIGHQISITYLLFSNLPNGTYILNTVYGKILSFLRYVFSSCFKRKDLLPV